MFLSLKSGLLVLECACLRDIVRQTKAAVLIVKNVYVRKQEGTAAVPPPPSIPHQFTVAGMCGMLQLVVFGSAVNFLKFNSSCQL
jgi:hypothetical protein